MWAPPRAWQGTRARGVRWSPAAATAWGGGGCGAAPWIAPYDELLWDGWATLVRAAGQGASWRAVATTGEVDPLTARRRWGPRGPGGGRGQAHLAVARPRPLGGTGGP